MKRYLLWTNQTSGEFIKADSVKEVGSKIQFIRLVGGEAKVVREVEKKDGVEYKEALWEFDTPKTTAPEYSEKRK